MGVVRNKGTGVRISIYVPKNLHRKMQFHKDCNFSKLFQQAFRRYAGYKGKTVELLEQENAILEEKLRRITKALKEE